MKPLEDVAAANILAEQGLHVGAVELLKATLEAEPRHALAWANLANSQQRLGYIDDAVASCLKALEIKPDYADAHRNLGILRLMQGRYAEGWDHWRWRWNCLDMIPHRRPFFQPEWNGEYTNQPLLVWAEQGIGDQVLYASMLRDLAKYCDHVVVEVDARLVPLFARSFPRVNVIPALGPPHPFALQCARQIAMGDLGRVLRRDATTFGDGKPYLKAAPFRTAQLAGAIFSFGKVVGMSWQSKTDKTVPLEQWKPLFDTPGLRLINLQHGVSPPIDAPLEMFQELDLTNDLDGVAALISACDVVVTASNSIAHMACALGKETHVVIPTPEARRWYWGETGSTWYPTAKVWRTVGDVVCALTTTK